MIYGATAGPFYNESLPHFKAKMRIANLLDKNGWDVWVDDMKGFAVLALTKLFGYDYIPREYRFDIYAERLVSFYEWLSDEQKEKWELRWAETQGREPIPARKVTRLEKVIIEIDYKGHLTKWSKHKGDMRDAIWRDKKIATIRFPIKDIVGKKKLDDSTILKEIDFGMVSLKSEVNKLTV